MFNTAMIATGSLARRILGISMGGLALACIAGGSARAADLKIVTFLQDDVQELFASVEIAVPAVPAGALEGAKKLVGPVDYYYDDCFAQFGAQTNADPDAAEVVIGYAQTRATLHDGGIEIAGGLVASVGDKEFELAMLKIDISAPGDRGALHYLVNRLAHLCRTGR